MSKDLFGFEDTRTEEERKIAEELDCLLSKYKDKYGMDVDLSSDDIDDEELIESLKKCLNENIKLSNLYPELIHVDDEYYY